MDRRNFIASLSAGLAGITLEQAIPFGRVWSFPKEIVIARLPVINGGNINWRDQYSKGLASIIYQQAFNNVLARRVTAYNTFDKEYAENFRLELLASHHR
jgi:hypothetical protein